MELGEFCEAMGFTPETANALRPVWEIAHGLAAGKERFFDCAAMLHYCRVGGLAEEIIADLAQMDQDVHADPLQQRAETLHQSVDGLLRALP